jgi:putative ABC transport system permease protein
MMTTQPTTLAPATAEDEDVDIDDAALADLQHGGIKPKESLRIAFGSLVSNKLRSLLTALGVIIGVAAVVALLAIGNGSQASITAAITANGANLLTVRPGAPSTGGVGGQVGSGQTLTTADAETIANPQNVPDASSSFWSRRSA